MEFLKEPKLQLVAALIGLTVLFSFILRQAQLYLRAKFTGERDEHEKRLGRGLVESAAGPASLLLWYYGLYGIAWMLAGADWLRDDWVWLRNLLSQVAGIGIFVSLLWFLYGATQVLSEYLVRVSARTPSRWDDVLLPVLGLALRLGVPILALLLLINLSPLPPHGLQLARKLLSISLVGAMTCILRRAVLLTEKSVLSEEGLGKTGNFSGRALVTRISVLRKIAMVLIGVFASASVLMMFDEARDLGKSIFASAGIAGIVLGLAAQRSLGNLFAGLQIALTQPVRIGDQVKIQDEVGFVEEITLTYVVVKIWDLRRLVIPLSYFIEQPIQNWTRNSVNMLSPVAIRVDFSFPVAEFRSYMKGIVEKSPFWDKQTFNVQVTGSDQQSMEVRVLGSAANPGDSGNLQCDLREQMIDWVHKNYPQCLPKAREEGKPIQTWQVSEEMGSRTWPLPPSRPGSATLQQGNPAK